MQKIHHPSPNFEARPSGMVPDLIVIHYTDLPTLEDALQRLCDPEMKVSAHYLISKTGRLYQLVDPVNRAWHAGVSSWKNQQDINDRSIGIELDNPGHSHGLADFPAAQILTLIDLLKDLTQLYSISPLNILGHSDVAPLRKKDPGELFPWDLLTKEGLGLWPSPAKSHAKKTMDILDIQKAFREIGYDCPQTGTLDETTKAVCEAFQRHFTPHEITGHPTLSMCQALEGLLP